MSVYSQGTCLLDNDAIWNGFYQRFGGSFYLHLQGGQSFVLAVPYRKGLSVFSYKRNVDKLDNKWKHIYSHGLFTIYNAVCVT